MEQTKKYWKGLEQLKSTPEFEKYANKEFPEHLPVNGAIEEEPSRRDFLKMMGFGVAAVSLAACEAPIRKAIPYVKKPESVDPGVPNFFASTYVNGSDYCSVVVKTREGRPIKVEGNEFSTVSGGGTSAQVEASVLSLYDKQRLKGPSIAGKSVSWDELDAQVSSALSDVNGKLVVVSNSINSPSTKKALETFASKYSNTSFVSYDQGSFSGALEANQKTFGARALPSYDFSKAKTIVSIGADFLGNWPGKTMANKQFASTRKLGDDKKDMSRLYAFESILSLTGANADYRSPIKPSEQGAYLATLYNHLAAKAGANSVSGPKTDDPILKKAAEDLWKSKGKSLVVSGFNDVNAQLLVNAINGLLESYGTTIDMNASSNLRQ
ncbi:MAG: TAT-variant-translocated molybdopterin oxidoreductase, partial [Cyclobacteriaceae bacterium]|nr:TAT-variant-translocated molybdopterin oxidoreductase [Cyclobacteriaceae bacterium HetDA_MAG_MS6]